MNTAATTTTLRSSVSPTRRSPVASPRTPGVSGPSSTDLAAVHRAVAKRTPEVVRPVTPSSALASLAAVLTTEQMKEFGTSGFLLLPGVVPDALLKPADAEIDAVMEADPPAMGSCGPHFYFHPVAQLQAADAALRESGALGLAEELVEPHGLEHAFDHIQIALNIPRFAHRPG